MKDFSPLAITSATVGFPARICAITRADGTVIRIAESDEPVVVDGDTYSVIPGLKIMGVKHTANGETPSTEIIAVHAVGGIFNTQDIEAGLFDSAVVQIWMIDRLNLSRKGLLFTGSISDLTYDTDNLVTFEVRGPSIGAKVVMTRRRSPMCWTDLFSTLCGVDKTSYAVSATVASVIDQFNFTVSGLAQADSYFNQGLVFKAAGRPIRIAKWVQSTQTITAYLPCNRIIAAGMAITMYPGCDKTMGASGCGKFSNWPNFQGEPHFLGTAAAAQTV
ncbi:putative phage protein (TIGR02218 family) [Bradyrhizobium elkanii]|uniref:DUF2163 domain-containing protein n=1 Tax=Bradyrhizobium elkanii TaxID=29448 RepID=UPI0035119219